MKLTQSEIIQHLLLDSFENEEYFQKSNFTLCHYTTAANVVLILKSGHIWMRQPHCMNDLTELKHGIDKINEEISKNNFQFKEKLNQIKENFFDLVNSKYIQISNKTYMNNFAFSLSEFHPSSPDGLLSMWRAYGGTDGACIVFKKEAFFNKEVEKDNSDTPTIFPLKYVKDGVTKDFLDKFYVKLIEMTPHLLDREIEESAAIVAAAIDVHALLLKHKAFEEEREWRLSFLDYGDPASYMKRETEIINGIPQEIYKLNFLEMPFNGRKANLDDLLDYILIGPTQYPRSIFQALVQVLSKAGIKNPHERIKLTNIPLRLSR